MSYRSGADDFDEFLSNSSKQNQLGGIDVNMLTILMKFMQIT